MTTAVHPSTSDSAAGTELLLRMYRRMLMIRLFEEQVNDLYTRALMPGLAHLYIGEEAVAVGDLVDNGGAFGIRDLSGESITHPKGDTGPARGDSGRRINPC